MDIKDQEERARKSFNNAMCIVGLSSTWVFIYLLFGRGGSFNILKGEGAYIILATMVFLIVGLITSRKILWSVIKQLIDINESVANLQEELVRKGRLAAVTETALTLSHEIDNPLMIVRGNLEVLQDDLSEVDISDSIRKRFNKMKEHCERISEITKKLERLSEAKTTTIHGDVKMIDIG